MVLRCGLESDSVNGGFVEQPYNPVSLKVGGFIGGAGHSCVFKDKYENWWQVTSMWVGNHDELKEESVYSLFLLMKRGE